MIDNRRLGLEGGELDGQVFRLCGTAAHEQADAHFPGLAVLAGPMADADRAVGGMIAEGPFAHDVLQTPRTYLDAVFEANL